jgi:hypothetical protein
MKIALLAILAIATLIGASTLVATQMAPTVCRAENGAIPAAANFRLMQSA